MNALSFKKLRITATAIFGVAVLSINASKADGLVDFDIGDTHVCIGLNTCLFQSPDSDNVTDHRQQTTDHRDQPDAEERESTVVVIKPKVRDHRSKVFVRDHRDNAEDERDNTIVVVSTSDVEQPSNVVVRDHRTKKKIRDHRVTIRDHR